MKQYLTKEFLMEHKKKVIEIAVLVLVLLMGTGIYLTKDRNDEIAVESTPEETAEENQANETEPQGDVTVDISGAVKSSIVVTLPEGSRVQDAIEEAGGIIDDADLSSINRAALLTDGEKVYIPTKEETESGITYSADIATGQMDVSGLVNINTADQAMLEQLDGIGPVTAKKIIEYRTTYGTFSSIEGIKEVNGIGDKTYEQIKDSITV